VVVVNPFRGLGLSQKMLLKVEEIARQRGCCKITLEVLEGNAVANRPASLVSTIRCSTRRMGACCSGASRFNRGEKRRHEMAPIQCGTPLPSCYKAGLSCRTTSAGWPSSV
jgi:hypothetical protein